MNEQLDTRTGWLSQDELQNIRANVPLVYVDAVPVRVDDLGAWWDRGVRIVGPAWGRTRYAGGAKNGKLATVILLGAMAFLPQALVDYRHAPDSVSRMTRLMRSSLRCIASASHWFSLWVGTRLFQTS